ncbi:MAG TPA: hypothetical protein PLG94_12620, partial [Smithellaceae bacterium]|nr:hypothetical protein [Smithellaceae bacterium]
MPTKLAKDRMRILQGSAKRNYSFPTGSCQSEIGNYMRLGIKKNKKRPGAFHPPGPFYTIIRYAQLGMMSVGVGLLFFTPGNQLA